MLDQMLELFLQNGLRPLSYLSETAELDREVNRSELTALLVLQFRGQLTTSALASQLGVPLSTTTSLVKRLVRKDLVNRTQSAKDQRIIHLELTEKGMQLGSEAKAIMEAMFARVQSVLSQEELQQFLLLAVKVGKAMQGKEVQENHVSTDTKLRKIVIDD
ncbi:MarR family winged helix-turn-helix transcriptional regulator [Paenibacillus sp. SI8]|uniref:MarR family winged helix-turn-helix transcriptional regulator n=1 Tax=unclassified Paenibacillus TaxID=185978 RepID=UPI0034668D0F